MDFRHLSVWITFLLFIFTGCVDVGGLHRLPLEPEFQIAPQFREFYKQLGGESRMGMAISPAFAHNGFFYQYTLNGLLVYSDRASGYERLALASLGIEMGFTPLQETINKDIRKMEYPILEEFIPLYEEMGGIEVVGRALTPPRFNPTRQRFEQYFEKLGFFRLVSASPGSVNLLAYGAWKCASRCKDFPIENSGVILPSEMDKRFIHHVNNLGISLTGYPVTPAYQTKDGLLEQVFDNMILGFDKNKPDILLIQPLVSRLGILADPLKSPSDVKDMIFISVIEGRGYHVPIIFLNFIERHGGINISGLPMSEYKMVQDRLYRQCFVNLCLEDDHRIDGILRIHPSPLGYNYAQVLQQEDSIYPQTPDLVTKTPEANLVMDPSTQVTIQVWEMHPWVSSQTHQEIELRVSINGKPIQGVKPYINIVLPNRKTVRQEMPFTNSEGRSSIRLNPIKVPSGTLIPYQVCVPFSDEASFCSKGDFLIMDFSTMP